MIEEEFVEFAYLFYLKLMEIHLSILFSDIQIITSKIKAGCILSKLPDQKINVLTADHIAKEKNQEQKHRKYKIKNKTEYLSKSI